MRLVLDTNTVLSALLWRGTPYRLLQAIRHQHPSLQLYSSPVLLEELTDVITRPSFTQRLDSIGKTVRQVLRRGALFKSHYWKLLWNRT